MTKASFIGDEWHCHCGNQPHTDGFYPCLRTGQYVEATEDAWIDGDLYRCSRCDSIIEFDGLTDIGTIVGQTEAQFVGMQAP
jgi:hypothetical protein